MKISWFIIFKHHSNPQQTTRFCSRKVAIRSTIQEGYGPLCSPELKWASKSASATLTLLHSELALCTFKVLFFFSVFKFWYKLLPFIFKVDQAQPMVTIWINLDGQSPMLHTKSQGFWPFKSWDENIKRFCHIWTWRIFWSFDPNLIYKPYFSPPTAAPHFVWFQSAQQF